MGFLRNFLRAAPEQQSGFERVSDAELERFRAVRRYGDFEPTDAVRPSIDLHVALEQGYRHDYYRDPKDGNTPVLMAAVTREKLFGVFMDLIDPMGETVDVALETSHNLQRRGHAEPYREHIDLPVLKSILWEYENLLTNDGGTGIAVLNPAIPQEVRFDEHKLLIMYGSELDTFEDMLREHRIACREQIQFITEAEHLHSTSDRFEQEFGELAARLAMDEDVEEQEIC